MFKLAFVFAFTITNPIAAPATSGTLAAMNLRTCDKPAPVGIEAVPYFGWCPLDTTRDALQGGYRIQVATTEALLAQGRPDVWDSGFVASNRVNFIPYSGPPLASGARYYWRVILRDDLGREGLPSDVARFDVGLLSNNDWAGANWIRRESSEENDYTLYRHVFDLRSGEITRAMLAISSCHKYELWINGKMTGKGPAYHRPQFQYYNAYDVTAHLRPGQPNAIAVFNRWWGRGQGRPGAERGLIAKLVVHYADGATTIIGTDGTWKQHRAEQWELGTPKRNRSNGIGFFEKIHADRIIHGWQAIDFNDSAWKQVEVIGPHPTKPWTGVLQADLTRAIETEYKPVAWTQLGENHFLVDFGKVRAGYPTVRFPAAGRPDEIAMRGGYTLDDDGGVSLQTTQSTDLGYTFVYNGSAAFFRPAEYLGMRYLEIENAPSGLSREDVNYIERHYELDTSLGGPSAIFTSDNAALDKVWQFMVDSFPVCTQEQLIDTPTREKGDFLGDAWSESVAAMLVLHDRTMTRRVLLEYLDSQDEFWHEDGRLNYVYPYDNKEDIPDYTQMYLIWVWDYYIETGDKSFLEANYGRLAKVMDYILRSRDPQTGLIRELEGGKGPYLHGIVDWPRQMRYGYDMETPVRTVINAYTWADLSAMAHIAEELYLTEESAAYARAAEILKVAMNQHLTDARGLYADGLKADGSLSANFSQQANMIPLALGIVPPAQRRAVLDHIKSLRMSCGLVTVRWLVEAIGRSGDGAHLVELFTNSQWDGWANNLSRGATCTWESWNAPDAGQSMSHAWGAIGVVGYVRYILGIEPLESQYARIRVRPLIFGDALQTAKGSIPTDRGRVSVDWKRSDAGRFDLSLELPDAMQAEVWVPCGPRGSLTVDGHTAETRTEGDYLVIDTGPGKHVLVAD
jgi:alpha-L-rhamnosidase